MYEELRGVTEYFGEEYAPADANRVLRVVRDFVLLFEKGLADIKVGECVCVCVGWGGGGGGGGGAGGRLSWRGLIHKTVWGAPAGARSTDWFEKVDGWPHAAAQHVAVCWRWGPTLFAAMVSLVGGRSAWL
jgi:hypothetical protein